MFYMFPYKGGSATLISKLSQKYKNGPEEEARISYCISLLKMGRYYNTTMCHYWDMLVK